MAYDESYVLPPLPPRIRTFDTGATRDTEQGKLDYEGFLSPLVLRCYAEFMHRHRVQSDGGRRDSDNWTRGIPKSAYMKSLIRHAIEQWVTWRKHGIVDREIVCAIMFNAMGLLFEDLRESKKKE